MKRIVLLIMFTSLILGAGRIDKTNIHKLYENQVMSERGDVIIIDYNRVKKASSLINFFPVYFYISNDKCNTILDKINKEDVVDIDVCIGFMLIDGFHHLRLELITPDSSVYQNIDIFLDRLDAPPKMVKFNNDYTPYNVIRPVILKDSEFIISKVPIAGSSIQTHSLIGRWKINLFIDDSSEMVGSISFVIE